MYVEFVTGNYFSTLGVGSYEGRVFGDSDDQPNSQPVAVLSYRSWQSEFGGDRSIIGQTVSIKFTGSEDSSLQTSFVLDDVTLTVK